MNTKCFNLIKAYFFVGFFSLSSFSVGQNSETADSLKKILLKHVSKGDQLELLHEISFYETKPDSVEKYAQKLISLSEESGNLEYLCKGYLQLGYAFRLNGTLDESLKFLFKSVSIASKNSLSKVEAAAYSAIGDTYLHEGNMKSALSFYRKSLYIFKQIKDTLNYSSSLLNYGEMYRKNKQLDSAMVYFYESRNLYAIISYEIGLAYCYGNLGLVYAEQGQHQLAEKNMNQAIAILEKLGDRYPIAVYQTSLADIYAQRKEYSRALQYAHSSLTIGMEEGLKEQARDASLKLSTLYKSAGNSDQAYIYLHQYIAYRDSINNEEIIRKMADLRTEYEVAKKQTEVDMLNKRSQINRVIAWSAMLIIALLLILTIALMKITRIKDRAVRVVRQRRRVMTAQRNQLDELNKMKDHFFSIISHDIRGPISNFQGMSGLIRMMAESHDVNGLKQLGSMIENSSKEVSSLLDNLLEWALSQEGKMPYEPEEASLCELAQSNIDIMKNMAAAKRIQLITSFDEDVNVWVDRNSASTIIRNLLNNAIKFTPDEGSVTLSIMREGSMGVVSVQDTGIGIPQSTMESLFTFKGKRSRWGTKGEKGIGLGLTLAHEFAELNQGSISVESEEYKGTTFKVRLPT